MIFMMTKQRCESRVCSNAFRHILLGIKPGLSFIGTPSIVQMRRLKAQLRTNYATPIIANFFYFVKRNEAGERESRGAESGERKE
jgi:hypothetical protein